ncbi:MAG: ABC transporter permease [Isosphaeraceae bacterium]
MTQSTCTAPAPLPLEPLVPLSHGFRPGAWLTVLRLSVEQFVRGRRLLALAALFFLPTLIVIAARYGNPNYPKQVAKIEELLVFYMIPQALLPLTALILASGIIRDEEEGQTLTYLLIRPIPRPSIYIAKLLAAWIVAAGLAAVFTTVTLAAIHWGQPDFWGTVIPARALKIAALGALGLWVYVVLFGGVSLVVRWVLPLGVSYIALFEGVFANIDFTFRRVTVLWYVRILAERWLGLHVDSWSIDLEEAPGGVEALATLLIASLVIAALSAWRFGTREIRMKTPEGS